MPLKRLTRITLLAALCVVLRQALVVGILSFLYGVLIDSLYAVLYHMPWWTYALVNGFSFNLAHALSTACFYPLLYVVFRRLYHEKNTL